MVKKKQTSSFDPFIRDSFGNAIGTRDPSPFFTGSSGSSGGGTTNIAETPKNKRDITNVELPSGEVAVGLSQKDFRQLLNVSQGSQASGPGKGPSGLQQKERAALINLAKKTGQLDKSITGQIGEQPLDLQQAIGAGLGNVVPGVAGGATVGAVAGGGIGAIPGALAGGVGGFLVGIRSSIKSQQQGKITAGAQALADGQANLNNLIRLTNADPANADEYQRLFNEQLSYIERDYGILKLDTESFLKDISGADGTPELANYQRFYDIQRDSYINKMNQAIITPNLALNSVGFSESGLGVPQF